MIDTLTVSHTQRAQDDPNMQFLVQNIEAQKELRARTEISLNIESRRAEREENLERALLLENERRGKLGIEPLASLEELDTEDQPDIHLDQAAEIVTDLAAIREIENLPAQAAQVRP
jgi:carboxyl-terminal processing protease